MEELTWTDAFIGSTTLKQLREKNNMELPKEYIKSTWKLAMAHATKLFLIGFILGYLTYFVIFG